MPEVNEFKFDAALAIARSPEQIEEDRRLQNEAAEKLQHLVTDSPAIAYYRTAVGSETAILAEIDKLQDYLLEESAEDYATRVTLTTAAIEESCERLAEVCFWQGKFAAAVDLSHNTTRKNEYLKFKVALLNLDLPLCRCTTIQYPSKQSAKGNSVPAKREIQRVFVGALRKEIKFIKCEKCGSVFAQTV